MDSIWNGEAYENWLISKSINWFEGRSKTMGQYHLTVNLDKKEFLMPHKLGVGLKLREQTNTICSTPDALFMLLACSNGKGGGDFEDNQNKMVGRWAGDRVAVVGDYASKEDLPMMFDAENIYKLCHTYPLDCDMEECMADASSHYMDITDMVIPVLMLNEPGLYINTDEVGWRKRELISNGPGWEGDMEFNARQSLDAPMVVDDLPF